MTASNATNDNTCPPLKTALKTMNGDSWHENEEKARARFGGLADNDYFCNRFKTNI